jgi:hypothetical protein
MEHILTVGSNHEQLAPYISDIGPASAQWLPVDRSRTGRGDAAGRARQRTARQPHRHSPDAFFPNHIHVCR